MRQKGFTPIIVIVVLAIIVSAFFLLRKAKNLPVTEDAKTELTNAVINKQPTKAEPYYPIKISAGPIVSQDISFATGSVATGRGESFGKIYKEINSDLFSIQIEIINKGFSTLKVGGEDFSIWDTNGNQLGKVVVNDGTSPYIPGGTDKIKLDHLQAIKGYVTFSDIPLPVSNFMEDFIIRYTPEKEDSTPIELRVHIRIPIAG